MEDIFDCKLLSNNFTLEQAIDEFGYLAIKHCLGQKNCCDCSFYNVNYISNEQPYAECSLKDFKD